MGIHAERPTRSAPPNDQGFERTFNDLIASHHVVISLARGDGPGGQEMTRQKGWSLRRCTILATASGFSLLLLSHAVVASAKRHPGPTPTPTPAATPTIAPTPTPTIAPTPTATPTPGPAGTFYISPAGSDSASGGAG